MKAKYKKLSNRSGKTFCDELWAKIVKIKFNNKCPICTSLNEECDEKGLNAHHLISRRVFKYRWDTSNGILLCPKHHTFDLHLSAHTAPWGLEEWLQKHAQEQYESFKYNRQHIDTDNPKTYDEIYINLEIEHKEITGEFYKPNRISSYIIFLKSDEIKSKNISAEEISTIYGTTIKDAKAFLKLNSAVNKR